MDLLVTRGKATAWVKVDEAMIVIDAAPIFRKFIGKYILGIGSIEMKEIKEQNHD